MSSLLLATFISLTSAWAGDCVRPPEETTPQVRERYASALRESNSAPSRVYPHEFIQCGIKDATSGDAIWISTGEPKCGQHSPYRRLELVSTERLKADYTEYVEKDLRLWVTDPAGKSVLLSKPDELRLPFTQSIYSCLREGPRGFTCAAKQKRIRCCRRGIEDSLLFEAFYSHPFQPGTKIRVRNDRLMEAVSVVNAKGRETELQCETARRFTPAP